MKQKFKITLRGPSPETTVPLMRETLQKRNHGLPTEVRSLPRSQLDVEGETRHYEVEMSTPERMLPSDIEKALLKVNFNGKHYPKISDVKVNS